MKKRKSRSPIKEPALRAPGQSLQTELIDVLLGRGFVWVVVAAMVCIMAAMEWARWYWSLLPAPITYTVIAVITVVIAFFRCRRVFRTADQLKLGRDGEISVGQLLDTLRADGHRIFHDIPEDGYNIDHVIIGPPGAFVIETKTRNMANDKDNRIRYDGSTIWVNGQTPERDPIRQVRACANRVQEHFKIGTGRDAPIRPVVLYPGWFVERQPKGVEVWVLNEKAFIKFLKHEKRRLTNEDVALFSSALETYVRTRTAVH